MTQFDYSGQVVLVTGGTKGIGAGIARAFLAAGATVIVCGRNAPEQLPCAQDREAVFMPLDVRDYEAAEQLMQTIVNEYGRLDVLVNNAGGAPHALAGDVSPRFHEGILRLNLIAPLNMAQLANRHMQQQEQGGSIIFIGSISALRASPGTAAYGAAKAGILSLTASLAVEWAPRVRVVAVSPGLVETEQSHLHYGDEAGIAAVAATIPAGRMATPEDIGNACLYMASPIASYAGGSNLLLNGGGEKPAFLQAKAADN
ncbi:SDR family oxidoreductase [Marinobacterium sp. AK62]|uniref:SDR family oxidoreductase n=1 Tax=Marinobacterium alkalitolerans TaxID=1542925 RepID=A0ABS3Z6X5_9GAMM|nr:SDR family oxidoreductase [Marinobacterium alkalitolerans]MBP0047465.1 SDR family oxidoreductase [Marinobacterium alkalitolerans]